MAFQVFLLILMMGRFQDYFVLFDTFCSILSLFVILYIVNSPSNPGYKIAWIIPIMLVPIFGGIAYLMFGGNKLSKRNRRKMQDIFYQMDHNLKPDEDVVEALKKDSIPAFMQSQYITKKALCPVSDHTSSEYLPTGEVYFERMVEELKQAKHFIFMEYFIVHEGKMWNTVLDILEQKVKEGVDVRFIYDDMGCLMTLPNRYYKQLEARGIRCCVFNPFIPVLTSRLNNRDHRKIVVIDGTVGFTGGINLADEYINAITRFGHWKDNGILLKGEAVWNLTVMFLSIWDYVRNEKEDYQLYHPSRYQVKAYRSDGFVQPYGDSPLDYEAVGETVYMNLINRANDYVYITTPYLIIDNEMVTALCNAAKSGVDVKIITPGIPDKKIVNEVTKAYYHILLEAGVEIYEYTPGFIHAKTFVVDDVYATVGTVNLDYRSLYLHFECGVWLYKSKTIQVIKKDLVETLAQCKKIQLGESQKLDMFSRMKRAVLRVFAPLM